MKDYMELKKAIIEKIEMASHTEEWYEMSGDITGEEIQKALLKHHNVFIPFTGEPIVLDNPIILSSNCHLKVDERQILMQSRSSETCLIRNEHIQDGAYGVTDKRKRDRNISIEGGIWNIKTGQRCYTYSDKKIKGSLGAVILCGVEQVQLKNMKIYDSEICGPRGTTASSYGIQICDCRNFVVQNIDFNDNNRDGVHVNGPAEYGWIKHIRGDKMGDDMVAMNAWDWDTSAITFGSIENIVVEDIKGTGNEFRLLPGQKIFENGTRIDCDIRNCVLENISGMYTFKLYAQPNISNASRGTHDVSGTVGTIEDIFFKNISFIEVSASGFCDIPVKSLFEICSNCKRLHMEDIFIKNTINRCAELDVRLINVGPLSAVWKNGSDNPDDWGEVFDPDAVCHADEIYLKNISFSGEYVADTALLTREVKMTLNPNYPKTTPRGGIGYGTIGKVYAE